MSAHLSISYICSSHLCLFFVVSLFYLCSSNQNFHEDVLCVDSERQALVQFKHGIIDETDRLASWNVGEERDCCRWVGVTCDNSSGQIHRINLRALDGHCDRFYYVTYLKNEEASNQMLRGKLSSSLLHLKELRHLDLSCNNFEGIKVPKFIGSLRNLRYLNLSKSNFGGMIPPQLGNLLELQVLCLGSFHSQYETTSMINMQWLSSLHLLHHLDMSGVDLSKATDWLQVINILPCLVQLHLSMCQLSNIHPHVPSLNLTSLSVLDLSLNDFDSYLPQWIFSIASLVSLDLSECSFHGLTRSSINGFHNLTSLKMLHVSRNDFMNFSFLLKGLSSVGSNLISLDISYCGVSSSVFDSLQNLTSLLSLDVSGNQLTKRIPKALCNFCNLRDLDLSYNNFRNISLTYLLESLFKCKSPTLESLRLISMEISGTIPDSIGRLSFLRSLDLHKNLISGTIPDFIGRLSFLRSLDLSYNLLSGPIPSSIGQLSLLKKLDLSDNQLNGGLPYSTGQLSLLKELDLSDNELNGSIPDWIGRLSYLEVLSLSDNYISGTIPDFIGRLSFLRFLYLYGNLISGPIPPSIGRLSSLELLDLSYNELNDSLPNSLGQLSKLESLTISFNLLTGVVTESHFAKLGSLTLLDGEGNNLTLRPRLTNWIPPFQLDYLNLNSWGLGPQFPMWLQYQKNLEDLVISNTGISSPMPPKSFWRSLPSLQALDMSKNHIQGTLKLMDIPATLRLLDLRYNELTGELTPILNFSFPGFLDLSNNFFVGSLHDLLCSDGAKQTINFYLENNHLSGVIPDCWEKWPQLSTLNLENNNFSGGIPASLGFLSRLGSLSMRRNKLSGRLHASLMSMTSLEILQLGRNELVGSIPSWVGTELSRLRILNIRSNNFDGNIPHKLCNLKHIQILDLAHNKLSGNIPRCFNNFSVLTGNETISDNEIYFNGTSSKVIIGDDSLVMKGREDTYNTILGLVTLLDLSCNNLVGNIPSELTFLRELKTLNFSGNRLRGRIPEKIGDMKSLETLDLSLNKLSGELPLSLSSMSFLISFNVSYNNLTGKVPSSTQLQTFTESSFFGNKLCGAPLKDPCIPLEVPKKTDSNQQEEEGGDWGLIVSSVLGFVFGFWIVLAPLMVSRSWRISYFGFLSKLRYMVYDVMHKYCFNMFFK